MLSIDSPLVFPEPLPSTQPEHEALKAISERFAEDARHIAYQRAKRSEAERLARRLADELARRGATEAEITAIVQEAVR